MSGKGFDRAVGRRVFGDDAGGYQAGRPDYPEAVLQIIAERSALGEGAAILEIGPGTGQATEQLLRTSPGRLVAVEPDRRLAERLGRLRPPPGTEFRIIAAAFEDAGLDKGDFDLGVAATSFHWLEARPALARIRSLLKPGGWWAMWWNVYRGGPEPDEFERVVEPLLAGIEWPPSFIGDRHYSLQSEARLAELREAGFVSLRFDPIRTNFRLSAAELRALYGTFSAIRLLDPADSKRRLDEIERLALTRFGDAVDRTFWTPLYTAQAPG